MHKEVENLISAVHKETSKGVVCNRHSTKSCVMISTITVPDHSDTSTDFNEEFKAPEGDSANGESFTHNTDYSLYTQAMLVKAESQTQAKRNPKM